MLKESRELVEVRPPRRCKHEIFNDHFQNYRRYSIPKAQLVIADIPYNVGKNAYGSNPNWYVGGEIKNGQSKLAGAQFFDTDANFNISEFMHFCSTLLVKEPKETGRAPCMIVFCAHQQQFGLIQLAQEHGFAGHIPLTFYKNFSPQVLKANMRIVGNCEYAVLFYRDKLPKFNNHGKMVFNAMPWPRESGSKVHPTQKPVALLQQLIALFTDPGEVVIDPCCGSGSTIIAARRCQRSGYGFEIKKDFHRAAREWLDRDSCQSELFGGIA
jgi:site-specific DNA-methyltransferase (adenine-specific)